MPFESEKQRKWMHANKPKMADEWEEKEKSEMQIKGSELKRLVQEELAGMIGEAGGRPEAMGGLRSRVEDAPEGETEWKQTGFDAREYERIPEPEGFAGKVGNVINRVTGRPAAGDLRRTGTYTDTSGRGGELADLAGGLSAQDAATASRGLTGADEYISASSTSTSQDLDSDEPPQTTGGYGGQRNRRYSEVGYTPGTMTEPSKLAMAHFRGPDSPAVPTAARLSYSQTNRGDLSPEKQDWAGFRPGGTYNVDAAYEQALTPRARAREEQRFQQGVDPYGRPMFESTQIIGSELKQLVQEELSNLMIDEGITDWLSDITGRKSSTPGADTDAKTRDFEYGAGTGGSNITQQPPAKSALERATGRKPGEFDGSKAHGLDREFDGSKALGLDRPKRSMADYTGVDASTGKATGQNSRDYAGRKLSKFAAEVSNQSMDASKAARANIRTPEDPYGEKASHAALNRGREARGEEQQQWGDTTYGKFQGRMGFDMGSKGHDKYVQDVIATTGGAAGGEDPRTADPEGYAQALARREQYASGGGGYGQAAGFQPALGGRNVFQRAGAWAQGRGFRESTQIKGSELKQLVQEELTKLIKEGGVMGHYMPNLVSASGDTPEDIAKQMLESGQEITDELATQAAMNAGVLDDDLPDFVDAIIEAAEDMTLRLSAPKEDPWKMKARLGIGGSVHDRLGGPRGPMGGPKK